AQRCAYGVISHLGSFPAEIPSVTPRLAACNQTSFHVTWPCPTVPVDGYEVAVIPMDKPAALTGSVVTFEVTGLTPGQAFEIFIQAQREQHLGAPGTLRVRTCMCHLLWDMHGDRRSMGGAWGQQEYGGGTGMGIARGTEEA
ncbi:hypothetical protein ASZ78_014221, partial [Callipepla squamata]